MTLTEQLVQAVVAAPRDGNLRLVLADHLEEIGDPRAADVRRTWDRVPFRWQIFDEYSWATYRLDLSDMPNQKPDRSDLPVSLFWCVIANHPDTNRRREESFAWWPDLDSAWESFALGFADWFGVNCQGAGPPPGIRTEAPASPGRSPT